MDALRVEVERIAGSRALGGLPSSRLATGSLSDVARVNRVQGLALGFGGVLGVSGSRIQLRPQLGYGTSDERVTGGLTVLAGEGATQVSLGAERAAARSLRYPGHLARAQLAAVAGSGGRLRGLRAAQLRGGGAPPPDQRAHLALSPARGGGEPVGRHQLLSGQRPVPAQPCPRRRHLAPRPAWRWSEPAEGSPWDRISRGGSRWRRERARASMPGSPRKAAGSPPPARKAPLPAVSGRGDRTAARLSELRSGWAGDPSRRAVPGLRGQEHGAGAGRVAAGGSGSRRAAGLLCQHRPNRHRRPVRGARMGRPPDRRGCRGTAPTGFVRSWGWRWSGSCASSGSKPEWASGTAVLGSV